MRAAARRWRWAAAALLLALALLGLAACGGDGDAPEPDPAARAAVVDAGRQAGAVTGRVSGQIDIEAEGVSLSVPFEAAGDPKVPSSDTTVDLSEAFEASGQGSGDGTVRLILIRDQVWMRVPRLSQRLGAKEWIHARVDELDELGVVGGDQLLDQIEQSSGGAYAGALEGAGADFGRVGSEEIDGVQTEHYRGTIDLDVALERATPTVRESLERSLADVTERQLPADVWVDDQGHLRRLTLSYEVEAQGQRGEGRVLVNFSDIGVAVPVSPPPASDVTEIAEVRSQLSGSAVPG